MQRTGTTSTGKFLNDHGYRCLGWRGDSDNMWSQAWFDGNFDKIFNSIDFRIANAFEDSPWWLPDFYRVLDTRFPNSQFILFQRDPNRWFDSMMSHSDGNVLGSTRIHCEIYGRQDELKRLIESGEVSDSELAKIHGVKPLKIREEHRQHYIDCYEHHNHRAREYFSNTQGKLFVGELEDPTKWQKLAAFLGVEINDGYDSRLNATVRSERPEQ